MHETWTDQLSAYLADELSPEARLRLEAHLAECGECREVLTQLRAVVDWAPRYAGEAGDRDLWPAIAAGIDRSRTAAFPVRAPLRFSLGQVAAAAILVAALSGGGVWWAMQGGSGAAGPTPAPVAADPGAPGFQLADLDDPDFDRAVGELEEILAEGRAGLDSATVRVIEQNLRLIDAAIADARAALAADPSNAYLGSRIRTTMQRKLVLLRQAARAAGATT